MLYAVFWKKVIVTSAMDYTDLCLLSIVNTPKNSRGNTLPFHHHHFAARNKYREKLLR